MKYLILPWRCLLAFIQCCQNPAISHRKRADLPSAASVVCKKRAQSCCQTCIKLPLAKYAVGAGQTWLGTDHICLWAIKGINETCWPKQAILRDPVLPQSTEDKNQCPQKTKSGFSWFFYIRFLEYGSCVSSYITYRLSNLFLCDKDVSQTVPEKCDPQCQSQ